MRATGGRPCDGGFLYQFVTTPASLRPRLLTRLLGARSPEALDVLLESSQFGDCLAALGLKQPPPYFRTSELIWAMDLTSSSQKQTRITMATFSFPSPAMPEDREAFRMKVDIVPLSGLFYELSPFGWSSRTLSPRPTKVWVCGPQTLPDGREAENALLIQKWRNPEVEDAAAGEERETRERWMRAVTSLLGLLAISVERYDMYKL